jgi:hypothetical protein
MPTTASRRYSADRIIPAIRPDLAVRGTGRLTASKSYLKGELLAELVGTNEVQSLLIDATGGTFTMTFGGQTTAATAWNASASTVQTNLQALSTIGAGNVVVSKNRSVWTLTNSGSNTAGTFCIKVTIGGVSQQTTAINHNDTGATIDTALELLSIIGTGGVAATGSASGPWTLTFLPALGDVFVEIVNDRTLSTTYVGGVKAECLETNTNTRTYNITFQGTLANTNVAAITTTATSLTGGAATATISTITAGAAGTPGVYDKYDSASVTGLAVPTAVLEYACTTDSSSNITMGDGTISQDHGITSKNAPVFLGGYFVASEINALTPQTLALLGGRIVQGQWANKAIIKF